MKARLWATTDIDGEERGRGWMRCVYLYLDQELGMDLDLHLNLHLHLCLCLHLHLQLYLHLHHYSQSVHDFLPTMIFARNNPLIG